MWLPLGQRVFWSVFVTVFYTLCAPQQYSVRQFFYPGASNSRAGHLNETVATASLWSQVHHATPAMFHIPETCTDTPTYSINCSMSKLAHHAPQDAINSWSAPDQCGDMLPYDEFMVPQMQDSATLSTSKAFSDETPTADISLGELVFNGSTAFAIAMTLTILCLAYWRPQSLRLGWKFFFSVYGAASTADNVSYLVSRISPSLESAEMSIPILEDIFLRDISNSIRQTGSEPGHTPVEHLLRFLNNIFLNFNDELWSAFGKNSSRIWTGQIQILTAKASDLNNQVFILQRTLSIKEKELASNKDELERREEELVTNKHQLKTKEEELVTNKDQLKTKEEELVINKDQLKTKEEELVINKDQLKTKEEELMTNDQQRATKEVELTQMHCLFNSANIRVELLTTELDRATEISTSISSELKIVTEKANSRQLEVELAGDNLKKSHSEVKRIRDLLSEEQIAHEQANENIRMVNSEKKKLEKSNKRLSGKVESLEQEKNGLRESLIQGERMLQVLETEKADQKKEIERFEKETTAHAIAASQLAEERDLLLTQNDELSKTIITQSAEIAVMGQTINDLTASTERANESSLEFQRKCEVAESQRSEAVEKAVEANERTVEAKTEALKARTTAFACEELFYSCGEKNDDLIKENERLRSEQDEVFSAVSERIWKLTGISNNLEDKVSSLEKENFNLQASILQKEEQLKTADAKVVALTTQVGTQRDLLLEKSEHVLELEHDFANLMGKYDLMNKNGEKLFAEFMEQRELVLGLQITKDELTSYLQATKIESNTLDARLAAQLISNKDLSREQSCEIQQLRTVIKDSESSNVRLEAMLRMSHQISQGTQVQIIRKPRRKHRAGKQYAKRTSRDTRSNLFACPEFVPFGGATYSALNRFNENAFMVVQDSAGAITKRPTLKFYCLLLLGVKTQPSEKDQLRTLQLLISMDVTPAHEALLRPRPYQNEYNLKSHVALRSPKIGHRRSGTMHSLDEISMKLRVDCPSLGYRQGHARSATTTSLEDGLTGLRITVPENCSIVTDISAPETEALPAQNPSEPTSSATSDGDRNSDSKGSCGDGTLRDALQDDSEVKENSQVEEDREFKDESKDKAASDETPTYNIDDGSNAKESTTQPDPQPTPCKICKRTTHTICWKCDHCEKRGEAFVKIWGSHASEECSHNAPARKAMKLKALHDARVARWKEKEAEKKALNEAYAARFLRNRK